MKRKDFTQDSYEAKVVGEAETNKQELGGQTMSWRTRWKFMQKLKRCLAKNAREKIPQAILRI